MSMVSLGIHVANVSFNKTISLKGMNGLQNGVIINSFDLPANDPAGGVHLTLNTTVTNPSQVGVALSSIGFHNYYQTTYIGPVLSAGAFVLAPVSSINLPLVGRLVPQTGSQGLTDLGTVFTNCGCIYASDHAYGAHTRRMLLFFRRCPRYLHELDCQW